MIVRKRAALAIVMLVSAAFFVFQSSAQPADGLAADRRFAVLTDVQGEALVGHDERETAYAPVYVNAVLYLPYWIQTNNGLAEIKVSDGAYIRVRQFSKIAITMLDDAIVVAVSEGKVVAEKGPGEKVTIMASSETFPGFSLMLFSYQPVAGLYSLDKASAANVLAETATVFVYRGKANIVLGERAVHALEQDGTNYLEYYYQYNEKDGSAFQNLSTGKRMPFSDDLFSYNEKRMKVVHHN